MPPNASEWFSDELLGTWNTMMPAGAALRSADEVFHTTTMTHSLHCLVSPRFLGPQFSGGPEKKTDRLLATSS